MTRRTRKDWRIYAAMCQAVSSPAKGFQRTMRANANEGFPLERGPCSVDPSILSKDHPQECQTGLSTSRLLTLMWLTGWQVCGKSLGSTWDSGGPEGGSGGRGRLLSPCVATQPQEAQTLSPDLLYLGRRGKPPRLVCVVTKVRHHPPFPIPHYHLC